MDKHERRHALADFLRTRRTRLSPSDVGLPWGSRRRTPGLRREEVAQLANIGTSWYVALEQGRDVHPSDQVLESLCSALRLNTAERNHLFLLARSQTASPQSPPPDETITSALQQAVHALSPHPVYVLGRRWDLLAWNQAAELVFAFSEIAPPHSRNFIWRTFTHPALRGHRKWEQLAKSVTAQFRADSARYPGDPRFQDLIKDLNQMSHDFRAWWTWHDVKNIPDGQKVMDHSSLGRLEFQHVTLQVPTNADQKVVIYTCMPDTAAKLTTHLAQ